MTATANLLASVGEVLLPDGGPQAEGPLLRLGEAWVNAEPAVAAALRPALEQLEQLRGRAISVSPMPEGLDSVFDHFRTVFGEEVWATLGRLAPAVPPRTAGSDPASRTAGSSLASRTAGPGLAPRTAGPGLAPRSRGQAAGKSLRKGPPARPRIGPVLARLLDEARQIGPDVAAPGRAFRLMLQGRLRPLLAGGAVLVVPTSPCPAPAGTAPERLLDLVQQSTLGVTAIAELCGLPEVTLPVTRVGDAPVGLSLIGGAGHDRALLALACDAAAILGLPVG